MFCPGDNNPGGVSNTDLFLKKFFIEVNWPKAQTHLAASFVMLSMWFTHHLVFLAPHDNDDADDDEVDSLGVRSEGEGVFTTQEPQMSHHGAGGSRLAQATGPSYSASHSGREDEEAAAAAAEEAEEEEEEDMVEQGHSHSLHLSRFHLAGCMLVCLVRARVWLVRLSQTVWVTPIGHA
eukprot:COSAG01_NODE_2332_length_7888_cov_3.688663_3_plen_179_part_00